MATEPDLALVRRAQRGDQSAFTDLVLRHQDRVFTIVRGVVRSPDDAADVTQEVFIAVLRHLDQFAEGALFTTWLHRIALRKSYDHLRRRVPEPVSPDAPVVLHQAAGGDPQATALLQRDLIDAIASLDQGFRDAVLLVDVTGVSVEEAAAMLEVAPGTVKSRVFRARAQLAVHLGTLGHGGASQ